MKGGVVIGKKVASQLMKSADDDDDDDDDDEWISKFHSERCANTTKRLSWP